MDIGTTRGEIDYVASNRFVDPRLRVARAELYRARKGRVASAVTTGYAEITVRLGNVGASGRHYS
jgi:hypothetical protein